MSQIRHTLNGEPPEGKKEEKQEVCDTEETSDDEKDVKKNAHN